MAAEPSNSLFGVDIGKLLAGVVSIFIGIVVFDGERALNKIDQLYEAQHQLDNKIGPLTANYQDLQGKLDDHEGRIRVLEKEFGTGKSVPGAFSQPIGCISFWDTDVQACGLPHADTGR